MEQTRKQSLIESVINTAIGFLITLALAPVIYPLFGHSFTFSQNLGITAIFTFTSIARGYVVRRGFNARIKKLSSKIASYKTTV
jgi:hypothetical protein